MKLRNKKTGEIVDILCEYDITKGFCFGVDHHDGNPTMACYNSLAELNEEWEDYEEPEEYWCLSGSGEIRHTEDNGVKFDKYHKEIGNYFSSREEAELAVRKLKAWKRLKDKGFKFTGHFLGTEGLNIHYECDMKNDISDDLDLLFSGEED